MVIFLTGVGMGVAFGLWTADWWIWHGKQAYHLQLSAAAFGLAGGVFGSLIGIVVHLAHRIYPPSD
jgi:hypothetical protein